MNPTYIQVQSEIRYWEDGYVNGVEDKTGSLMPLRNGGSWCPVIRLSDGAVMDWPVGTTANIHYKVCDAGRYWLLDDQFNRIAEWDDHYVPNHLLCPGEQGYGDYIIMQIDTDGKVQKWRAPRDFTGWAVLAHRVSI